MVRFFTDKRLDSPDFYHHDYVVQLRKVAGSFHLVEDPPPPGRAVNVFLVRFRLLRGMAAWLKRLDGPRLIIDHDAYMNFIPCGYEHAWEEFFRQTQFDLLISSGKHTAANLRAAGVPAAWVSKGFDEKFLAVPNAMTGRIGCFGVPMGERGGAAYPWYSARRELRRAMSHLPPIETAVPDFPAVVSRYSGAYMTDAGMGEPMAKHFECSALGCVPIRDYQEELYDLGYDDSSMKCCTSWAEAVEITPAMQEATRRAAGRHTWAAKAAQVMAITQPYGVKML